MFCKEMLSFYIYFNVGLAKFPISERREKNQFLYMFYACGTWRVFDVCIQQLRYNNSKLLKNDRCGTV